MHPSRHLVRRAALSASLGLVSLLSPHAARAGAGGLRTVDFPPPARGNRFLTSLRTGSSVEPAGLAGSAGRSSSLTGPAKVEFLNSLPFTEASIEFYKKEASRSGSVGLVPYSGSLTRRSGDLVAVHSYVKYKRVPFENGVYAYGVKTYIRADFTVTRKRGSVGFSLIGLAASASRSNVQGNIMVSVAGISGPKINDFISMPARLSEDTVTQALQSFAVIKSKIFDEDTVITPVVVGMLEEGAPGTVPEPVAPTAAHP